MPPLRPVLFRDALPSATQISRTEQANPERTADQGGSAKGCVTAGDYRTVPRFLYQRRMFFNDLTVRGTSLVPGSTLRENNSVTLEHQACDVAKRFKVSRFQVAGPAPSFFPSFSSLCQSLGLVHVMNRATFQFVPDTEPTGNTYALMRLQYRLNRDEGVSYA
eukprot:2635487-Rhodomonas_salina.1